MTGKQHEWNKAISQESHALQMMPPQLPRLLMSTPKVSLEGRYVAINALFGNHGGQ